MASQKQHAIITPGRMLLLCLIMCAVLLMTMAIALVVGTVDVSFSHIAGIITGSLPADDPVRLVVMKIRLPRIILAGIAGFALALGGVVFQAILRNPLADPFILGVSSGSAFGAVLAIFFGLGFSFGVPVFSFCGALLTIYLVMSMGAKRMGMESSTILLTGVIINAFFTAVIMFFISVSADERLHSMLFWLYGDLSRSRISQLGFIAVIVLGVFVWLYSLSKELNIITTGDDIAAQLGVNVDTTKKTCLLLVSLLMGLVVAFSGLIGFVGLIVPHLARMAFRADHRMLMPVAALGGAIFLIAADTLARTLVSPGELPVGVITAFMGAPFFILLLRKRGGQWSRS
jgi:iron complex transport system permease protein